MIVHADHHFLDFAGIYVCPFGFDLPVAEWVEVPEAFVKIRGFGSADEEGVRVLGQNIGIPFSGDECMESSIGPGCKINNEWAFEGDLDRDSAAIFKTSLKV